jgi:hypothetical protein
MPLPFFCGSTRIFLRVREARVYCKIRVFLQGARGGRACLRSTENTENIYGYEKSFLLSNKIFLTRKFLCNKRGDPCKIRNVKISYFDKEICVENCREIQ